MEPPQGLTRDFNHSDLHNLNIRISVIETEISSQKTETKDFRNRLENWMEKIDDKLSKLPCDKREGKWDSLTKQVACMWGLMLLIVTAMVTRFFK